MSKSLIRSVLIVLPILIGLFVTRSPFFMTSEAPAAGKPWADRPIELITTPQYETKKVNHHKSSLLLTPATPNAHT